MPKSNPDPDFSDLPSAVAKPKRSWALQIIWIVPIVAILVGLNLAYKTITDRGPTITISFKNGDGLEAGKTVLKYKGINIGTVEKLNLSDDYQYVIATVQLEKDAKSFTSDGSQFWVVRPRISTSGVSGISTLLSGPYIAAELGGGSTAQNHFVALEVPPVLTAGIPGREFILKTPTLGSHDIGTQVFFRRLTVGEVVAYELDKDGKEISIKVFIHAPYDQYVTSNTRFWNASGIDVTMGASGIHVQTESLVSVLVGGIAFETLQHNEANAIDLKTGTRQVAGVKTLSTTPQADEVKTDTVFPLFQTRSLAMRQPESISQRFVIDFKQSVRGLAVGAPVEFRGVHVGEVVNISLAFNPKTFEVIQPVEILIFPERLQARSLITGDVIPVPKTEIERAKLMKSYIDKGLRAQLRTGSLLTGMQYVGIDFFPAAPKYNVDVSKSPLVMQAVPSLIDNLEQSVSSLIKNADKMVKKLDAEVIPELSQTLKNVNALTATDSPLQTDLRDSLREVAKAAGSIKTLTDMLDQQPQSLIFGKPQEKSK
jgi:paraquat-inducible protein B